MKTCYAILLSFAVSGLQGCDRLGYAIEDAMGAPKTLARQAFDMRQSGRLLPEDRSSSLLGIDADMNGVRDDIDAFIAHVLHPEIQEAAWQHARGYQRSLLVNAADRDAVRADTNQSAIDMGCVFEKAREMRARGNQVDAREISATLQELTYNTQARKDHDRAMSRSADGMVFSAGKLNGNCEN
ncbi:hypothetical protein [Comamonas testosteroni]|uniref:hypothetical protein n=1 Tax=Comamonas testosteroni TaxID=285 RepID=UPI0005B48C79|nr:hypothetical protein [Comamonas testosteroni]